MKLDSSRFASMLSAYAAGLTQEDFPLGSGECWARAQLTAELLDYLPLRYVEGVLHSDGDLMGEEGKGAHAFCVLGTDDSTLVIDPMVGQYACEVGDTDGFVWEFDD